jgi:hypothetical protein
MMFKDFLKDRMPVKSQAKYVEFGYGQVEPNHLSAQRTGQIYAQLPADPDIEILEQGQFVKYDYAADVNGDSNGLGNGIGLVNFTGAGEWMLVYNEIKLYRDLPDGSKQWDCEFAMLKDDYQARIYSPYDYENAEIEYKDWHRLNGTDEKGNTSFSLQQYVTLDVEGQTVTIGGTRYPVTDNNGTKTFTYNGTSYELDENGTSKEKVTVEYAYDDVTKDKEDYYEWGFTNDPWRRLGIYREKRMPAGTTMVPRVFKTNVGDIFTTNTIDEETLAIGDILAPKAENGILHKDSSSDMKWQVVKLYTMPDGQKGVKIMRIA